MYAQPGLSGHSMHSVCELVLTRADGREDKVGLSLCTRREVHDQLLPQGRQCNWIGSKLDSLAVE